MPLSIDRLTKTYGSKTVLRDFSYTFPSSGVVLLQGPSGSGKTTLLRMIAGLEKPDSGGVRLPPNARLSMVFQENRLLPTLGARDNILAAAGDTPENRALAEEYLARLGLVGEEERLPSGLSGGMRRRVAIARAMVYGGDLLLLDEPFKGLDRERKEQVMDIVFRERNRLVLFVTHDPAEAERADHILSWERWK